MNTGRLLLRQKLERGLIRICRNLLLLRLSKRTKRLIVFLTPGWRTPTGGILSIASLYRETLALPECHNSNVVLCNVPGDAPLLRYAWFKNSNYILEFASLLRRCSSAVSLLVHIPEYAATPISPWLEENWALFSTIKELHFNILIQNIDAFDPASPRQLAKYGYVTCTTAHDAYSTAAVREVAGVPLHKLSVFMSPEQYRVTKYGDKENLLVYSPDPHPLKDRILRGISSAHPNLVLKVISGLSYERYRELIGRAKWCITFGEGLDFYFAEPILSGSVSFATFNERFFTQDFSKLPNVYSSWNEFEQRLAADIRALDNPTSYDACSAAARQLIAKHYSVAEYRKNLRDFYLRRYTFP